MKPLVALVLSAGALVLDPGWGALAVLAAVPLGADRGELAGLALLALAPLAATAPASGDCTRPGAVTLVGRWRSPPGQDGRLETPLGDVAVRFTADVQPPAPGEPVRLSARLTPGSHALVVGVTVTGSPRGAWLDRWARATRRRVSTLVRRTRQGLVAALVLGRRRELPNTVRETAAQTGTLHLFALSGLHVILLARLTARLLAGIGVRNHMASGALLVLFGALSGARPPLQRATTGWWLGALGATVARGQSPLHRLAVVALLLLVWQPGLQHDLGARLSFLAVAGFVSALSLGPPRLRWLTASAGAFLSTAPLAAETFGRVQPWGLLVTPIALPLVSLLLLLGLVTVIPGSALSVLDPVTGPALDATAGVLQQGLALAAGLLPAPRQPAPLPLDGTLASMIVVAALIALAQTLGSRRPLPADLP